MNDSLALRGALLAGLLNYAGRSPEHAARLLEVVRNEYAEYLSDVYTKDELVAAVVEGVVASGPASTDELPNWVRNRYDEEEIRDMLDEGGHPEPMNATPDQVCDYLYGCLLREAEGRA